MTGKASGSTGTSSDQNAASDGGNKRKPWLAAPAIMLYGALVALLMV